MNTSKMKILFVYGTGGHKEQMRRLIELLDIENPGIQPIALCEYGAGMDRLHNTYSVADLRPKIKIRYRYFYMLKSWFKITAMTIKILFDHRDINTLISTGPGLVIPVSIIFKVLQKRVIYIETWSRFYTKSFTGKIMYYLSSDFIIQNRELVKLYPHARYGGRL